MGIAYTEFGLANPEPYRIMFMTRPDLAPAQYQGVALAKSAAFNLLVTCVQDCLDAGRFRPEYDDVNRLALGFWARVHGLTSLMISQPDKLWPDDPEFLQEYADICLRGVVRPDR
jgi:WHG domain-containing protein